MVDRQINAPDSSQPEPLSLKDFAASLYHAERADNFFKFLKNFSVEDLASFLQGLLRQVGDAIDDGSTDALARFVEQGQVAAYVPTQIPAPFRPDFPDAPFSPLRKPLREATVALFSSGAIYRDDQDAYYPAGLTYEQAVREVRRATERFPSLRVIPAETPEERLLVGHVAYDIRAAQKDINVIFPLTRFHELAQEGVIDALRLLETADHAPTLETFDSWTYHMEGLL
jgi:hypothetical protein